LFKRIVCFVLRIKHRGNDIRGRNEGEEVFEGSGTQIASGAGDCDLSHTLEIPVRLGFVRKRMRGGMVSNVIRTLAMLLTMMM